MTALAEPTQAKQLETRKLQRFRVLDGYHYEPDPSGREVVIQQPTKQVLQDGRVIEVNEGVKIPAMLRYCSPRSRRPDLPDRGDIVESYRDLEKMFNSRDPGFPKKFEKVHDDAQASAPQTIVNPGETEDEFIKRMKAMWEEHKQETTTNAANPRPVPKQVPATNANDTLDSMSYAELLKYCEEEEIDIGQSAKNKEQVLQKIRESQGRVPTAAARDKVKNAPRA